MTLEDINLDINNKELDDGSLDYMLLDSNSDSITLLRGYNIYFSLLEEGYKDKCIPQDKYRFIKRKRREIKIPQAL